MASKKLSLESLEDRRLLSLSVPQYSSLPSAPATLYLDFNGHTEASWGGYQNVQTPAYDTNGNPNSFSSQELAAIKEIWSRVAEDYAPFNLNVTTVDPGGWSNPNIPALRVAIGGSHNDWFITDASGASYQSAYTNPLPNVVYVFEDDLYNGLPSMVADIASHEAGHAYGLRHNHEYDSSGNVIGEYSTGNSPEWAPLMGNSLFAERSTWYNGPSTSINNLQDDIAEIASASNGFGFRSDDYSNSIATASSVIMSGSKFSQSGIIGTNDDVDVFWFDTPSGNVTLSVEVADLGANLDSKIELRRANGTIIKSASPTDDLESSLTANVTAGRYYAVVRGAGQYGDLGRYTLRGKLPSTSVDSPTASISGPSELVVGQMGTFVLGVTDASGQTSSQQYTFAIDYNSDGTIDQIVQGTSGTKIDHTFQNVANHQITITAIASNGSTSDGATTTVETVPYQLQADKADPSKTNLVVGLSEGNDIATAFSSGNITGVIVLLLDGKLYNQSIIYTQGEVSGRLIMYGLGGDDYLTTELSKGVEFHGGDGNDVIIGGGGADLLYGDNGDDLLYGRAGADVLVGGNGRDVLIGGTGSDWISGEGGEDLLVAGDLTFDRQSTGIFSIWDEWRLGGGYLTRTLHLTGQNAGGYNGNYTLKSGTSLKDDAAIDYVFGNDGTDLFADIGTNDLATDIASNEIRVNQM